MDNNFDKIMEELQTIHKEFPDLRFGLVIQTALDTGKKKNNVNLSEISSKQVLNHLKDYERQNVEKRRKYKHKVNK